MKSMSKTAKYVCKIGDLFDFDMIFEFDTYMWQEQPIIEDSKKGVKDMFKFISFVLVIGFMMVFGCSNLLAGEKPPLSGKRITGEILAGGVGGYLLGYGGCAIGVVLEREYRKYKYGPYSVGEYTGLLTALYVFPIGYTLGNAIGVYLVGNTDDETGSFLATLGGSILGLGVGIILDLSAEREFPATFVASSLICATVGFNLTRRYSSPPATRGNRREAARTAPIRLDLVKVRF